MPPCFSIWKLIMSAVVYFKKKMFSEIVVFIFFALFFSCAILSFYYKLAFRQSDKVIDNASKSCLVEILIFFKVIK